LQRSSQVARSLQSLATFRLQLDLGPLLGEVDLTTLDLDLSEVQPHFARVTGPARELLASSASCFGLGQASLDLMTAAPIFPTSFGFASSAH
jgi:hypothetical protein